MTGREDDPSGPGRRQDGDQRADNPEVGERGGLPPVSRGGSRDFPGLTADFRIDILDHDDEVIVVAELPGAEKDGIRINLLNPQTLRITARRTGPVDEEPGTYSIHERGEEFLTRVVRLPASVIEDGAGAGFKNGVLEVSLKKMGRRSETNGKMIPIE
jgi:HSP20 family protein